MNVKPLALLLVLLSVVTACGDGDLADVSSPESGPESSLKPLERLEGGDPLPEAELAYLDGDGALQTSSLRGAPAVVNFWATWCAFCVEEMPELEAVHRELDGRVRFVGVDVEDGLDKARTFAARLDITYDLVVDPDRRYLLAAARRNTMPSTLFVDADGTIVHRHLGPLDRAELRDLIERHLDVTVPS